MARTANTVEVDMKKLRWMCRTAVEGLRRREGLFHDYERLLPQHNLPAEVEGGIGSEEGNRIASNFLFVEAYFERVAQSRTIIKRCLQAWGSGLRWVFSPEEVVTKEPKDLVGILTEKGVLDFGLANGGGSSRRTRPEEFYDNAVKLVGEYDSDGRKLVEGRTAEESRKLLMEFGGIRTIGNLFITYLADRNLAHLTDPENAYLKVDTWKAGIPMNLGVVKLPEGMKEVRREVIIEVMEPAYCEAAQAEGLSVAELDRALWVIGTAGCSEKKMRTCKTECDLFDGCEYLVPKDATKGVFVLYEGDGTTRGDARRSRANSEIIGINHSLF